MMKLQEYVKENEEKVLIILEGRDSAGKGSTIKAITESMNPKHFRVEAFGIPTEEENKDWFKRYEKVLPKKEEIVFFDRSWYNRATIEPVMGYCTKQQYKDFMKDVVEFEEKLIDKGYKIIKLWLSISKNNQQIRFSQRGSDPLKYWKLSDNDTKVSKRWDDFTHYIDKMFEKTGTKQSPWIIVDSNDKLMAQINAFKNILRQFDYEHKNEKILQENTNGRSNIIFLDIHGNIILEPKYVNGEKICFENWDEKCIAAFNALIEMTGAKIVITSSCRHTEGMPKLVDSFKQAGIVGDVIGGIEKMPKEKKAIGIRDWLEQNHHSVNNFVILDDNTFDLDVLYPNNFVKTESHIGLADINKVKQALDILNKDKFSEARFMVRNVLREIFS